MDGHRGLVPPDPISNSAVKKATVLFGTVLLYGKNRKLSTFYFFLINFKELKIEL